MSMIRVIGKICSLVIACLIFMSLTYAKEADQPQHALSLTSHRIGAPGQTQRSSYFSGYGAKYDYHYFHYSFAWISLYSKLTIGTYRQAYYQNALYSDASIAIGYQSRVGIDAFFLVGAGYMRSFDDSAVYEINSSGEFEQVRDYGRGGVIIPFSFELAYRIEKNTWVDAIFLQYRFDIQTPFAADNDIPIMAHEYVSLGFRF